VELQLHKTTDNNKEVTGYIPNLATFLQGLLRIAFIRGTTPATLNAGNLIQVEHCRTLPARPKTLSQEHN
jgi:hypothetical protein